MSQSFNGHKQPARQRPAAVQLMLAVEWAWLIHMLQVARNEGKKIVIIDLETLRLAAMQDWIERKERGPAEGLDV